MRTVTVSHNWYSFPRCSGTAVPTVFGVPSNILCRDRGRMCQAWSGLVRMKSELGHSLTLPPHCIRQSNHLTGPSTCHDGTRCHCPNHPDSPCYHHTTNEPLMPLGPQCFRWLQPQRPLTIPSSMPINIQHLPPPIYNRLCEGILCHQLPEEVSTRMVQKWHYGTKPAPSTDLAS